MPRLKTLAIALGVCASVVSAYAVGGIGVATAVAATAASLLFKEAETARTPAPSLTPDRVTVRAAPDGAPTGGAAAAAGAPVAETPSAGTGRPPTPAATDPAPTGGAAAATGAPVARSGAGAPATPVLTGLPNPGNTCYLNAALQLIRANPTLIQGLIDGCTERTARLQDLQELMQRYPADAGRVSDEAIQTWREFIPSFAHLFPQGMAIGDDPWIKANADVARRIAHLPTISRLLSRLQRGSLSPAEIRELQAALAGIRPAIEPGAQEDISLVFRELLNIVFPAPRFDTVVDDEDFCKSAAQVGLGQDAYFDLGAAYRPDFSKTVVSIGGRSFRLEGFALHLGANPTNGHYVAYLQTPDNTYVCINDDRVVPVSDVTYREAARGANLLHLRRLG